VLVKDIDQIGDRPDVVRDDIGVEQFPGSTLFVLFALRASTRFAPWHLATFHRPMELNPP
jgi:hypothetical protein